MAAYNVARGGELDSVLMQGPLGIVATAVTPVVMVSATAILIGGVNAKHQALADRVRLLMAEFRNPQTSEARKRNVLMQVKLFRRRLRYATLSHLGLYVAAACFITMVMIISLSTATASALKLTLPFFIAGVSLLLGAVLTEVLELLLANKTLDLEIDRTPS